MKTNDAQYNGMKNDFSEIADYLQGKSVLITGGTGYVGKNLVEILHLLKSFFNIEIDIFVMGRSPLKSSISEATYIQHDMINKFNSSEHFDYIIHAATPVVGGGEVELARYIKIIADGAKNILDFCKTSKCSHFLDVSSGAIYGSLPFNLGVKESYSPPEFFDSKSGYISGKRIGELLTKEYSREANCNVTIARGFAFSGRHLPLDKHFAIGNFVHNALKGLDIEIKGSPETIRSYMDSEDMVFWLLTILFKGKNGNAYNVGSDVPVTMYDLALKISQKFNKVNVICDKNNGALPNSYFPSVEKAQQDLSLSQKINLDTSIERMIEQYNSTEARA